MKRCIAAFAVLILVACGQSGGSDADKVEELQKKVADLEAAASSDTASSETTTAVPTTSKAPATTATPTTLPPTTAPPANLMPDVVCMNLQDAQDFIQATTDIFYSQSVDATGQGRLQAIDSNWIVVDQTPSPGTPIGEGDAILSVVKLEEANPC